MKKLMSIALVSMVMLVFSSAALNANPTENTNNVKLFYDENGQLYNGKYYTYYENGAVFSEFDIVNGKIQNRAKYFYETGEVKEIGLYNEGIRQGKWIKYAIDGKVIAEANFTNDHKDGTWKIYSDNGKLLFEMQYDNDKKIGTWYQWDEAGNLVAQKNY